MNNLERKELISLAKLVIIAALIAALFIALIKKLTDQPQPQSESKPVEKEQILPDLKPKQENEITKKDKTIEIEPKVHINDEKESNIDIQAKENLNNQLEEKLKALEEKEKQLFEQMKAKENISPTSTPIAKPTEILVSSPIETPSPIITTEPSKEKIILNKITQRLQASVERTKNIIDSYEIPGVDSQKIAEIINAEANSSGIDPMLITAIVYAESTFKSRIVSKTGKIGLMQIHPDEAVKISQTNKIKFLGVTSLYHARANILFGTLKFKEKLKESAGDMEKALIAYNSIEGDLESPEAIKFKDKVIKLFQRYKENSSL